MPVHSAVGHRLLLTAAFSAPTRVSASWLSGNMQWMMGLSHGSSQGAQKAARELDTKADPDLS